MHDYISGIQQIGIGVKDASECLHHYAKLFGMTTLVFNDESEAILMKKYTGGVVYKRQAFLSLNLQGGGGFEIWQYKDRQPTEAPQMPEYGDIGIYAPKIKCRDIIKSYAAFYKQPGIQASSLQKDEKGDVHFWVKDQYQNVFNLVTGNHWFQKNNKLTGGVCGAVIGVSDMESSRRFYQSLLSIDKPSYDKIAFSESSFNEKKEQYRKVLLQKQPSVKGAFGKLLGSVEIELVQCLDRKPNRIFENRLWGDCGFIHLCFDVFDMCSLKKQAAQNGYPFTIDSLDSFGMESASGRFAYMEDPDGTLIELVETHKVAVYKKWGLYIDLKKRGVEKPLPGWMIKLLALSKVK